MVCAVLALVLYNMEHFQTAEERFLISREPRKCFLCYGLFLWYFELGRNFTVIKSIILVLLTDYFGPWDVSWKLGVFMREFEGCVRC